MSLKLLNRIFKSTVSYIALLTSYRGMLIEQVDYKKERSEQRFLEAINKLGIGTTTASTKS